MLRVMEVGGAYVCMSVCVYVQYVCICMCVCMYVCMYVICMINSHLSNNLALMSIYNFTIIPHIHDTTASIIHIMKINQMPFNILQLNLVYL